MQKLGGANGRAGIKIVRRTLADGSIKEYHYKRDEIKPRRTIGALRDIFNQYAESNAFRRCAPRWQAQALVHMRTIEDELGWMTADDLENVSCRRHFYALQAKFTDTPHKADALIAVLSTALAWAYDQAMISVNHCTKIKRLVNPKDSPHRDKCYSEEQERLILAGPSHVRDLYQFALYTGLRLGDMCVLPPSAIDKEGWLRWRPSKTRRKTNTEVWIPTFAMPPLRELLPRLHPTKDRLLTRKGVPWLPNYISRNWPSWIGELGVTGMRFHDIRHTTSTRLVLAGCTEAERAMILGHATSDGTGAIYTARVKELALRAYQKWWKLIEDSRENTPLQPELAG